MNDHHWIHVKLIVLHKEEKRSFTENYIKNNKVGDILKIVIYFSLIVRLSRFIKKNVSCLSTYQIWFNFSWIKSNINTGCMLGVFCKEERSIWKVVTWMLYWRGVLNLVDILFISSVCTRGTAESVECPERNSWMLLNVESINVTSK